MIAIDRHVNWRARLEAERARRLDLLARIDHELHSLVTGARTKQAALSNHHADGGSERFEQERALTIERGERAVLDLIEQALTRLDDGTYGHCDRCGQAIPAERLEAIPYAQHCVVCQAAVERGRSTNGRGRA